MPAALARIMMGLAGMGKGIASRYATGRGIPGIAKRTFARKPYQQPVVKRTGEGFKTRPVMEQIPGPWKRPVPSKFHNEGIKGEYFPGQQEAMKWMPQGRFYRKPYSTSAMLAAGAGGLGLAAAPFLPEKGEETVKPRPLVREVPWSAPEDMMTYAEGVEASANKKDAMLKDMIKYSVLLSALGQGGGKELMAQKMDVMDAELEAEEHVRFAKAVQAVYGGGNPPQNAREAYERLAPIVGPEHAATLSGHQLGFDPKRTASERLRRDIIDALETGGREAAINVITLAWASDPGTMPQSAKLAGTSEERLRTIAGQMVDSIQSGGGGLIEGLERID